MSKPEQGFVDGTDLTDEDEAALDYAWARLRQKKKVQKMIKAISKGSPVTQEELMNELNKCDEKDLEQFKKQLGI